MSDNLIGRKEHVGRLKCDLWLIKILLLLLFLFAFSFIISEILSPLIEHLNLVRIESLAHILIQKLSKVLLFQLLFNWSE